MLIKFLQLRKMTRTQIQVSMNKKSIILSIACTISPLMRLILSKEPSKSSNKITSPQVFDLWR